MAGEKMPIPSRARCLELGATFIENDLHQMRAEAVEAYRVAERDGFAQSVRPLTSSHENDLMKAVEWATAAATLRLLAERGDA